MTSLTSSQTHVGCLVATVVLGKSARSFQREVERLLSNNGPEWLVARQKAIWTAANHLRNGDADAARSVYQDASIAYHRGDMTPKGPYRPVVRGYVEAQRPSVIRRYAAVLRFYSTLVLPELSEKQSSKARSSITDPIKGSVPEELLDYARSAGRVLSQRAMPPRKRQSQVTDLAPNTYTYSRQRLDRRDRQVPLRPMAMSLLTEGFIPKGLEYTDPFPLLTRKVNSDGRMGRISPIQEQGAKARVVAMPSARLQLSFLPLHDWLNKVDEGLPSSVMNDQQRGVFGLLEHMQDKPAHSTDLSSATDRFPRSFSLAMLEGMGMGEWADAISEVSQSNWDSPWGDVSYSVGQPMGLKGSFPLFHLSNQVVASFAERKAAGVDPQTFTGLADLRLGGYEELMANRHDPGYQPLTRFPNGYTYYVLGDDIVFSDVRVRDSYVSVMDQMGVDISDAKSFSGKLTEFAGFVLTSARGKPFAFRPYKPPPGKRVSNPVDFLAALGTKARVIKPYWARQVSLFAQTWADRSPDLSPWVTMDRDPVWSQWDPAVLDNEFNLLSEKYPESVPALSPTIEYSTGKVFGPDPGDSFVIEGLARDTSRDVPRIMRETSRERLGERPKDSHRRGPSPLSADPLIRKVRERAQANSSTPIQESPGLDSPEVVQTTRAEDMVKGMRLRFPALFESESSSSLDEDEPTLG